MTRATGSMPDDQSPSETDPNPAGVTGRTTHTLDGRGFVRDWLVSPAWSAPCTDLDEVLDAGGSPWGRHGRWTLTNGPDVAPLKRRLYARRPLVTDQELPGSEEGGAVRWIAPGGEHVDTGQWTRAHAGADGLLDWSQFCHTPEYRHAVAATVLEVDQAEWRTLELACTGPAALWVGDALVAEVDDVSYMEPVTHRVRVRLESGATRVLLATWQVAFRECRHVASLRVLGLPVRVVLPSPGADEYASATAEQLLDRIGSPRWALTEPVAHLTGPPGVALEVTVADPGSGPGRATRIRLDTAGHGRIPLTIPGDPSTVDTADPEPDLAGDADGGATASMLATGETRLTVRVDDPRCPVSRTLHVAVLPGKRRAEPVGDDPAVWRAELLRHVAAGQPSSARALATAALDPARPVRIEDVTPGLAMVDSRADCADFEAVGLIHLWHRLAEASWPAGLPDRVAESLLGFKYWIDQPGRDAMCYFTENHQLVWHTAEILAGEAFPQRRFRNTGWTGAEHAEHGRTLAVQWIRRKLTGGFSEFDSNAYLAIDSLALVSLMEYTADTCLAQLAEALLDKLLLTLACNSWRGVHGAAHGRSYTQTLRSSRLEETAPIMWLLWGTGALNAAVLPATALATAKVYRLPPLVRAAATEPPREWDGRQVYRGHYRDRHDLLDRPYGSDLRIWRTPATMLSSVQDYRSGLPGLQEHVWGATLGSEVQVFATHPAASAHGSSARPNAWAGQRVLPRARQHRDTVLVVHRFPPDDPAPRTHLWFPTSLMDEWTAAGPWLAGRVGDGLVAIAADGGFCPVTSRDTAWQEWWPQGGGRAYVATVADRNDGTIGVTSLAQFVAALAEPVFTTGHAVDAESARDGQDGGDAVVHWTTRDGRQLRLGWAGPFTVDGHPVDLDPDGRPETPPHLDNPACRVEFGATRLEARWAGHTLVLDLASGRRIEP
jgi:hypothetical protein